MKLKTSFFFAILSYSLIIHMMIQFVNGQQATSNNKNNLQDLYLQDSFSKGNTKGKEIIKEDEGIKTRENQNRLSNSNDDSTDNFWNQLNFGDFLLGDQKVLKGQVDEIDTGRERTQLGQRRNIGTSDKGRIQYQENAFTDSGNNYEDLNENVKTNKNKFAGRLENTANIKGVAEKDKRIQQQNQQQIPSSASSSLLNDYGARERYSVDNNFGNFLDFEDSSENFQGSKSGKKISNFDKTGNGKKLDHIYDKQTWDNSELVYDNDKIYQKLKSTKLLGLSNEDVQNKYGNQNQGEDHSRNSNSNDVGSSNSQKEGYQKKSSEKEFNQNSDSGTKIVGQKSSDYNSNLEAKPSFLVNNYQ